MADLHMPPFPYLRLAFRTARSRQGRAFIAQRMRTLDGEHCSAQSTQWERGLPPKHHYLSKIGHFYFAATWIRFARGQDNDALTGEV